MQTTGKFKNLQVYLRGMSATGSLLPVCPVSPGSGRITGLLFLTGDRENIRPYG